MKKLLVVFVCLLFASTGWASDDNQSDDYNRAISSIAPDEQLDQGVIISPQDPAITSIVKRMDEAQANGDVVLFRQLLSEYKILNPQIEVKEGPQVSLGVGEPATKSRWIGDDIEVDSAYNFWGFSMDTRNDTRIYLAASRELTSGADWTIPVWYSDDGISWTILYNIQWGGHDFLNPSLKIVETPDTDYIFVAFESYETSSPYDHDILVVRGNLVSGDAGFHYPADNDAIDEMDPSLDADDVVYPSSPYLHLAFESGDSIAYMRSLDRGTTWVDRAIIGVGNPDWNYYDPSLAYGPSTPNADSMNLGVAWSYNYIAGGLDAQMIRFRRNISKGASASWLPVTYFNPPADCFDDSPSLKMTHSTLNSATIAFARLDTAGTDEELLCNYYTYDAGRNWAVSTLYNVLSTYEALPTLAMDDSPNDYHVFFKGVNDDIRYKETHYDALSAGDWTTSISISDSGNISDEVPPASAVRGNEPCVCWKTYAPGWKLMFDALWLVAGVDEKQDMSTANLRLSPNPSNGIATLSYIVEKEGNVKIAVYNPAGILIKNLLNDNKKADRYELRLNNNDLPSGIYFIQVSSPDGVFTKTMTVIR